MVLCITESFYVSMCVCHGDPVCVDVCIHILVNPRVPKHGHLFILPTFKQLFF